MKLVNLDLKMAKHAEFVDNHQGLKLFLQLVTHSCDSWYWLIGIILVWLFGKGQSQYYAINLAFGLGLLAVFVLAIKFLVRRPRPEGDWGQVYRLTDPHSFPSGHAARAMAIAAMATVDASLPIGLIILLWFWAVLVGYSRVALRLHYVTDVIAGWAIGLISGLLTPLAVSIAARLLPGIYHWLLK